MIIANTIEVNETGMTVIEMLSDFGLVLLMFCLGLEINIKKIRKQGRSAMVVAVVQLPVMVVGGIIAGTLMGMDSVQSLILGAIISGCSTAVVTAVLKSQDRFSKEQIETIILIMIMEDIGQVVMLSMLTPVMAGSTMGVSSLVFLIASIALFMVFSLVIGLKVMPRMIRWISDNVSFEILIVFSVGLAFGMAWLATVAGLSMAIGAFLMGMLISASRKSKEIGEAVEPMKSLFMSMFFISVGMEVHFGTLLDSVGQTLIIYILFFVLLVVSVSFGYWLTCERGRVCFTSAVSLTAMGEFAFIISKEAFGYGAVSEAFYTSVIGAALLSMMVMPFVSRGSDRVWDWAERRCPKFLGRWIAAADDVRDGLYSNFRTTTKKSRRLVRRGMTSAYIELIVIVVIEVVFFFAYPVAGQALHVSLGGNIRLWYFLLVMLNFVVLIPPTTLLVSNVREIEALIVKNSRRLLIKDGEQDLILKGDKYRRYLETTTLLTVAFVDLVLIAVIPNPLGLAEHLYVIGAAIVIVILLYMRIVRMNRAPVPDDGPEDAEGEQGPPEYVEDAVRDTGEEAFTEGARSRKP